MERERCLRLEAIHWRGHQLWILADLDGHRFTTTVWYGDVELERLRALLGAEEFERLVFHIAAFELNKLCSFTPTHLSFGPYSRFVTARFTELWSTVLQKVWAQWRYEHDLPDWKGPELLDAPRRSPRFGAPEKQERDPEIPKTLLLFGGGKDSLVAAQLLERAGEPYSTLTYSHSVYGPPEPQHALVEAVLEDLPKGRHHKQWIGDDAFAAPVSELMSGTPSRSLLAAETPSSIFAALPTVLTHGYGSMVLAHEFSANRGNLIWPKTGEEVNHQWGKSWEAERALSLYVAEELVSGFHWFSILEPLSDVLIFELLRDAGPATLRAHSCNMKKPWCYRCAKCAYVALGYAAHLPDGVYERVFAEDVLDLPENELFFRQMIGLSTHTPFECIGEIDEARLALALCLARGRHARAVELFRREGGSLRLSSVLERYGAVHVSAPHGIPDPLARKVLPLMLGAEQSARERIVSVLASPASR